MPAVSFLDRYRAGEHEAVWAELVSLGPAVFDPPLADDAWAVVRETMRRARINLGMLVERLDSIGYAFWDGVQGLRRGPPTALTFGERRIEAASTRDLLSAMFEAARSLPPSGLTAVMVEQLFNIYQMTVWPLQDSEVLLRGEQHPADAAARTPLERAKRSPPAEVVPELAELARLCDAAVEAMTAAHAAREAARPPAERWAERRVLTPPRPKHAELVARIEARGARLPLAVRAWVLDVGGVCLAGSHPKLCFWEDATFPGVYADPLMAAIDLSEIEARWRRGRKSPLEVVVGWDARTKARLKIEDRELDEGYSLTLPGGGIDAPLDGGAPAASFVEYLRLAFRWGGFPGWAGRADAPMAEIEALRESLLPI